MPRVTNPPRKIRGDGVSSQKQQSVTIPLNDDRQEKAVRFQSRQVLHDLHMNQIKAAASPLRPTNNHDRADSSGLSTPQNRQLRTVESGSDGGLIVAGTSMTPMKRVPILANFEEWMKMATDNKINATNSWNFALIDYFHDMSLLKEGDGVNFQKASCTLDGCVKIYTSRVDSVASETGKLLSGLADSGNKRQKRGEGEQEPDEDGGEGVEGDEDGTKKRMRRRAQRSSEATLAPSFAPLHLKKFDLEFSVDPLFKKASADFDEGGAKGLLLNHLGIDVDGRVVFDSSDNIESLGRQNDAMRDMVYTDDPERKILVASQDSLVEEDLPIEYKDWLDLVALRSRFIPDLTSLDEMDLCPSLKSFDLGDPLSTLDIPFLEAPKAAESHSDHLTTHSICDQSGFFLDGDNSFEDDDDGVLADVVGPKEADFGDGGEAWAKKAILNHADIMHDGTYVGEIDDRETEEDVRFGNFDPAKKSYEISLQPIQGINRHEDILSYFDKALKKTWAGPEHWRIRRMRDTAKSSSLMPTKRKEREPFQINFNSSLDPAVAGLIYTLASSRSSISLPKAQWNSRTRNLLPDDKHFSSQELLPLFLKPKARLASATSRSGRNWDSTPTRDGKDCSNRVLGPTFWAHQEIITNSDTLEVGTVPGQYDANFFQDDAMAFGGQPLEEDDDDEFVDVPEGLSATNDCTPDPMRLGVDGATPTVMTNRGGAFGAQLVTQSKKFRPEYVHYAKVAKKVDVRRLKEELWKGIGFDKTVSVGAISPDPKPTFVYGRQEDLKFTEVINNLRTVYPTPAMADISTSFCFICLLHLANEEGLSLAHENSLTELSIRKDPMLVVGNGK